MKNSRTSEHAPSQRLSARDVGLLATLCTAQVLEVLGVTVVIVALPAIGRDLGMDEAQVQLVVSLYAVLFGGLLLTAGRIADLVDRRLVFAAGLVVTLAGTLTCALAATSGLLLAGRAVQGLGGAIVTPSALSLLTSSFPRGRTGRIAVSAWTAAAAGGGALGFVVGGLLVDATGWRAVFWLLVPLTALTAAATLGVVPAAPPRTSSARLDVPGAATAVAGLVLLVRGAGLVEHPDAAPLPPAVVVLAGCALLVLFVVLERRSPHPLVAWHDLTNRVFMTANGAAFVNTATTSAAGTLVALVTQRSLGLDARATGLILLPFSLAVVAGSVTGGWWLQRPPAVAMAAGLAVVSVAMVGLALATAARSVAGLVVAVAVAGTGLSWAAVSSTSAATRALPPDRQGVAGGAVNTAAQIGTALGVAVLVTVAASVGGAARSNGYVVAFTAAAVLAGGYAALLVLTGRRHRRPLPPATLSG